jgi:gliding motility-associated-like protein
MKTYSNIEDLYREKFSAYMPEPSAEVWERIQQATGKKPSIKGKAAIFATAVVVAILLSYWGINTFFPAENSVDNQRQEQLFAKNTPSQMAVSVQEQEETVVQNEPLAEKPKEKVEIIGFCMPVEDLETPDVPTPTPNNLVPEQNNHNSAVSSAQPREERKVVEEDVKTEEKTKKTEESAVKTPPIIVNEEATIYEKETVKLFIPSAFTPNGDGLNDEFFVKSDEEYSYFEMNILSRDGKQLLFKSKDINRGWDGTYKGVLQPHGPYLYFIKYVDAAGKMHNENGTFLLLLY